MSPARFLLRHGANYRNNFLNLVHKRISFAAVRAEHYRILSFPACLNCGCALILRHKQLSFSQIVLSEISTSVSTMFLNRSRTQLLARQYSKVAYSKPYNNRGSSKPYIHDKSTTTGKTWDHLYGLSSVLSALHSKKRSTFDTLYIQESDEKKTTQKKDATLLEEITQLAKDSNIYTVAVDKGRLNNLTDNKTHQVKCFLF